jgi:hypothetical protein
LRTFPGKQSPTFRRVLGSALSLSTAIALAIPALTGCGGGGSSPSAITITGPAIDTIDPGDSASFTAAVTGGSTTAGVTWTLTNCSVSTCGSLSNSTTTGVTYTAPATVATAFTVTLTAAASAKSSITQTVALNVPINPAITTPAGALPGATFGAAYTTPLAATGGITPYTWTISQGALPTGLAISSTTGAITGSPTAGGTSSFSVTLTDSGSPALTATTAFTLTTVYPTLSITTTSLPHGTEGTAYSATLAATGGSNAYTWTVTAGTGLSATGLSLSPSGAITGIPTTGETSIPVTIQVTDSAGNTASATFTVTVTSVAFQGQVLSGTTPVNNATIQLYAAGATGNMSAATPMLTQTVISDGLGMFQLAGLYTCGQSSTGQTIPATAQLYLVASGGTTSTTSTTSNPALTMVTAVGPCTNLTSTSFDTINELTTAAAAWALSPFASSTTTLGATATNTLGLTNAFLDAALLANPDTGAAATLPTSLTVETAKLSALADALNTCTTGQGTACTALFTAATTATAAPTDTFAAALAITQNPGQNVAAIFATLPTTPPFPTTLTASPNDWTMSLTITGGGLFSPTALGIDSHSNIWVADEAGPLSAFNPQGTPLPSAPYGLDSSGVPYIVDIYGLAIDTSDNIWVTEENGYGGGSAGSVTEFYGVNNPATAIGSSPNGYGYGYGSVNFPVSIAADTNGNIFAANTVISSATEFSSSGAVINSYLGAGAGLGAQVNAIALDLNHGFWISNNELAIAHFSSTGTLLANVNCCSESLGIATDSAGDLWIADYLGGSDGRGAVAEAVTDSSNNTTVPISGLTTGGINYPGTVAVDSAQNVWLTNRGNNSITELAGIKSTLPIATAISPSTGVYTTGGYGLDAGLDEPYTLLPDRSGNLWVSNEYADTVTMFFGLAAPTVTPLQPVPTAP